MLRDTKELTEEGLLTESETLTPRLEFMRSRIACINAGYSMDERALLSLVPVAYRWHRSTRQHSVWVRATFTTRHVCATDASSMHRGRFVAAVMGNLLCRRMRSPGRVSPRLVLSRIGLSMVSSQKNESMPLSCTGAR